MARVRDARTTPAGSHIETNKTGRVSRTYAVFRRSASSHRFARTGVSTKLPTDGLAREQGTRRGRANNMTVPL
eukprot:1958490-Prymnesium_polylepis.1